MKKLTKLKIKSENLEEISKNFFATLIKNNILKLLSYHYITAKFVYTECFFVHYFDEFLRPFKYLINLQFVYRL